MRIYLRAIYRTLRLIVRAAPGPFWRIVVLNLLFGAGPALLLWLGKVVIDYVAATAPRAISLETWFSTLPAPILAALIGVVFLTLATDSLRTMLSFEISAQRDRVTMEVQQLLYAKSAGFDSIVLFEEPELMNLRVLAEGSVSKIHQLMLILTNVLDGLFRAIPSIVLSATIAWWVPLVLLVVSIPSAYIQLDYERRQWGVDQSQAPTARAMRAHAEALIRPDYAKDLRVYGLADYFLRRWRRLYDGALAEIEVVRRRGTLVTLAASLFSGVPAGLIYLFVVFQAVRGALTLGDVALFAGLVFEVRLSTFILIANAGELQNVTLRSGALFEFLDYDEGKRPESRVDLSDGAPPRRVEDRLPALSLVDVSFTYPGAAQPAVRGVTLHIGAGETVVIVGENGAGKTTLAKLLCRLYAPSAGTILLNDQDYRQIPLDDFRREVAVLFQDFARFPATLRENIGFGRLDALDDDAALHRAASQIGLTDLVASLPKQLDTPLSKELEEGVELSGGQWQRVAIARALMRSDAKLVILDEPTAALDPRTEYEALSLFRELARTKTAVIISHRLALARIATTVVVMEHGQIIERGTHDELMQAGGLYAEMFARQASSYVDMELPR